MPCCLQGNNQATVLSWEMPFHWARPSGGSSSSHSGENELPCEESSTLTAPVIKTSKVGVHGKELGLYEEGVRSAISLSQLNLHLNPILGNCWVHLHENPERLAELGGIQSDHGRSWDERLRQGESCQQFFCLCGAQLHYVFDQSGVLWACSMSSVGFQEPVTS